MSKISKEYFCAIMNRLKATEKVHKRNIEMIEDYAKEMGHSEDDYIWDLGLEIANNYTDTIITLLNIIYNNTQKDIYGHHAINTYIYGYNFGSNPELGVMEIKEGDGTEKYDISTPEHLYDYLEGNGVKVDNVVSRKYIKLQFLIDIGGNYTILDFDYFELLNDNMPKTRFEQLRFISSLETVTHIEISQNETTHDVLSKVYTLLENISTKLKVVLDGLPKRDIQGRMSVLEKYLQNKFNVNE